MDTQTVQNGPAHRSIPSDEHEEGEEGSNSDSPSSDRRRFPRGGRRRSERGDGAGGRESRMPPAPKPTPGEDPVEGETLEEYNDRIREMKTAKMNGGTNGKEPDGREVNGHQYESHPDEEGEEDTNGADSEEVGVVCDKCKQKAPAKTPTDAIATAPPQQQPQPSPFETGIRAFNVKRAQNSGGRPIEIRASSRSDKASSTKTKNKPKKKKKKAKKVESSSEESSDDEDGGEEKRKPMSIKLELNLMVEIFLKAKIKGDVTITFME